MKDFFNEDGQTLAQVTQRGDGSLISGNIQGEVGQGLKQPDLVEDVPAHGRTRCPLKSLPNSNYSIILQLYDCMENPGYVWRCNWKCRFTSKHCRKLNF